jgi:hypothetical protein
MAFLDNSGDIILDAVLTDTGRARLAKGDGTFKIVKFALADDEIDYSQYRNSNHPDGANPSGSAYYDLEILMTPILEAFTNNTSSMKSKVISIPRNNLLYLPVVKLNDVFSNVTRPNPDINAFYCMVDKDTEDVFGTENNSPRLGVMYGENSGKKAGSYIRLDQGLDTEEISSEFVIDNDLLETQYIVEIDNRFGSLVSGVSASPASVSFIDDDNVASYYLSLGTDTEFVFENGEKDSDDGTQVIAGPRGTYLQFKIQSSLELNSSEYLFTRLGTAAIINVDGQDYNYYFIDSNVRITGATTGYSVNVPVRFVKVYEPTP